MGLFSKDDEDERRAAERHDEDVRELRRLRARMTADVDQAETSLVHAGRLVGSLWRGMVEGGAPEHVASYIAVRYAFRTMCGDRFVGLEFNPGDEKPGGGS